LEIFFQTSFFKKGIQAWVTTAVDDDEAFRALMLAESLKRSATTRKLVVIFGTMVSKMRRYVDACISNVVKNMRAIF
jgi:hypothetical protein